MKNLYLLIILSIFLLACNKDDDKPFNTNWDIVYIKTGAKLTDVKFYNNIFGVITGSGGTLLKTYDGGDTWGSLNVGTQTDLATAFLNGEDTFYTSSTGVYKTINRGDSFVQKGNLEGGDGVISAMHFFDPNNGIIYKNRVLWRTSDGGDTWQNIYNYANSANKILFLSNTFGIIYGGQTSNGTSTSELHRTTDAGVTWNRINVNIGEITIINFIDDSVGFLATKDLQFYKTNNGGVNLQYIGTTPIEFTGIAFLNENVGYAVGKHKIFKTEDNGRTWTLDYEDGGMNFTAITKTKDNKFFAITENGKVLRRMLETTE